MRVVRPLSHVISLAPSTSELSVCYESRDLGRQFVFQSTHPRKRTLPTPGNEGYKCPPTILLAAQHADAHSKTPLSNNTDTTFGVYKKQDGQLSFGNKVVQLDADGNTLIV